MISREIDFIVWRPNSKYEGEFDPSRCARSVAEGGRSVSFHQCSRRAVEQVGGYGWCKQHAVEARRAIGQEEEKTETIYLCGRSVIGAVFIERIDVISRTDKSINAAAVHSMYGGYGHGRGQIRIGDSHIGTLDECKNVIANTLRLEADSLRIRAANIDDSIVNLMKIEDDL